MLNPLENRNLWEWKVTRGLQAHNKESMYHWYCASQIDFLITHEGREIKSTKCPHICIRLTAKAKNTSSEEEEGF